MGVVVAPPPPAVAPSKATHTRMYVCMCLSAVAPSNATHTRMYVCMCLSAVAPSNATHTPTLAALLRAALLFVVSLLLAACCLLLVARPCCLRSSCRSRPTLSAPRLHDLQVLSPGPPRRRVAVWQTQGRAVTGWRAEERMLVTRGGVGERLRRRQGPGSIRPSWRQGQGGATRARSCGLTQARMPTSWRAI
jgi:hypothetical protein